ncbi:enoyl CoA hydratase domain-containing protein 1 [Modicella reniformis]|uniref:Enoyl CoA hydratase domain-containing protein 1 n=1 Tax=Modicella reniformis TaxID=1440133 RepID=A0A9P6J6M5_9FUNG|nr:enoyl CoA hydratase domain-containing protein 1 [Modicella reniformis]
MRLVLSRPLSNRATAFSITRVQPLQSQRRQYACQFRHPTKLDQLRAKLRAFGKGHIELDLNHSPGLALLTLSNPTKHNALTGKMMAELADCVDFLEEATAASGGPTSIGTHNSQLPQLHSDSGLVLKYLSAAKTTLLTSQAGSEMSALMVSTLTRFMRLPLLTIAAVEKAAIGGGAELTTCCDHRCLTDQAKVQFVQTQMGVVTGWGGASRLLPTISNNRSLALRLLASAEPMRGGQDAIQSGFAQCTAPVGKAVERATEYMQPYVWERLPSSSDAQGSGGNQAGARRCVAAVRAMKRIVSFGLDYERVERVSELEKDLFKQLWGGSDNLARVDAATSVTSKK